jgi:N-acetylglucosaminyldiphosphoundecaprenol N-acetyl-beta-D-mannosaminyltransferase
MKTTPTDPIENPKTSAVLGVKVHHTSYEEATRQILHWAQAGESHSVYAANVHMVMEARDDPEFMDIVNSADLVTPDGMPLVWALRRMGNKDQERVYGPTLTGKLLPLMEQEGIPIGFLGSTPRVIEKLSTGISREFPSLNIAYAFSPPFHDLDEEENREIIEEVNRSGAKVLFVGMGCPKQEKWIDQSKAEINAVMVGVGAAFDYLAGTKPQAPLWFQKIGMEWFFRLLTEPTRLWRRYFRHNPRFLWAITQQLWQDKR